MLSSLHKKHLRFLLFISLSVQKCTKKISPPAIITPNQKTYVTCKVTNTGKRAGNQGTVNHIIDNELSTFWEGNKGDYITFALENEAQINSTSITFNRENKVSTDFEIQLSSGGGQFLTVYSGTIDTYSRPLTFNFKETIASDLRIVLGSDRVGIAEVKLPQLRK